MGAQVHIIPHHPYLQKIFGLIQPPSCFEAGFTHSNAVMQVSADLGSFSPLPFPLLALKPCQFKYAFQCNIALFCLGNRSSFSGFGLFCPPPLPPLLPTLQPVFERRWENLQTEPTAVRNSSLQIPMHLACQFCQNLHYCLGQRMHCLSSKTLYSAIHMN